MQATCHQVLTWDIIGVGLDALYSMLGLTFSTDASLFRLMSYLIVPTGAICCGILP